MQKIKTPISKKEKTIFNLYGEKGIGRTLFAYQVAYQCRRKELFEDGIFYFDMNLLENFNYQLD